ncbi:MAG TPA: hypothetical protein QF753_20230, partial [Victivallales bacterium]|nr:hypothetical protein [Victivallales bacterium]
FLFKYIISMVGSLFGLVLFKILLKIKFLALQENATKYIFETNQCIQNKKYLLPRILFSIYILLMFVIIIITSLSLSPNIQISILFPVFFIGGILIGYVTQKVPVGMNIIPILLLYSQVKLYISITGSLTAVFFYVGACFLTCICGSLVGYRTYSKSKHLLNFKKINLF